MHKTPLQMLADRLFHDEEDQESFREALKGGDKGRRALIHPSHRESPGRPLWIPSWATLEGEKGDAEYELDLSELWKLSPLARVLPPRRILDLCAAHGGSTIVAHRYFPASDLLSNEVSLSRSEILHERLSQCSLSRNKVSVTNYEAEEWRDLAERSFDLVIVDPPCSEQAKLSARFVGMGALDPITVRGNSQRQIDILTAALTLVSTAGFLIYTTSTFSIGENEHVLDKVLNGASDFVVRDLGSSFRSLHSEFPCYRLYPQQGLGYGGFTCLIQRKGKKESLPELPSHLFCREVRSR